MYEIIKKINKEFSRKGMYRRLNDKYAFIYNDNEKKDWVNNSLWILYENANDTNDFKFIYDLINELNYSEDSELLCLMANFYLYGNIVKKDLEKAYSLLLKSYKMGNGHASVMLAYLLYYGKGIKHDPINAINMLERSALQLEDDCKAIKLIADIRHDTGFEYHGKYEFQDRPEEYFWRELPLKILRKNSELIRQHALTMQGFEYDVSIPKDSVKDALILSASLGNDDAKEMLVKTTNKRKNINDFDVNELIESYYWLSKIQNDRFIDVDIEKEKEEILTTLKEKL